MSDEETALTVREEIAIMRPSSEVALAFEEYQKLQARLDAAMPESIIEIGKKKFRTKKHWLAIAVAFGVDCRLVEPPRKEVTPDGDWGYIAHAQAIAPNGRTMDAMGACFASEKSLDQATIHNILAHAETRARLRAISNLVGFGDVSAEEMIEEKERERTVARQAAPTPQQEQDLKVFDMPLGFGKYKTKTWRYLTEGEVGGERYSYLEWLEGNIKEKLAKEPNHKYAENDRKRLGYVQKSLRIIESRADRSAQDQDLPLSDPDEDAYSETLADTEVF